jgi:DNA-binding MarR family transcriptional regulator
MRAERVAQGLQPELSDTQLAALAALEVHPGMTPSELAEHEKVQPPSITRVIASLEERGLLQRIPHTTDRRQVVLSVTDQGRDVVRKLRKLREAWLAQRLRDLSPAERAVLREALPILEKLSQS